MCTPILSKRKLCFFHVFDKKIILCTLISSQRKQQLCIIKLQKICSFNLKIIISAWMRWGLHKGYTFVCVPHVSSKRKLLLSVFVFGNDFMCTPISSKRKQCFFMFSIRKLLYVPLSHPSGNNNFVSLNYKIMFA